MDQIHYGKLSTAWIEKHLAVNDRGFPAIDHVSFFRLGANKVVATIEANINHQRSGHGHLTLRYRLPLSPASLSTSAILLNPPLPASNFIELFEFHQGSKIG